MNKLLLTLTLSAALPLTIGNSQAYEPKKDWPCVQVKVPELSPGMMWAGPAVDGANTDWRKSPKAAQLGKKLTIRRYTDEEVAAFIKQFADGLDDASRTTELTRLFAASFHYVSVERHEVMSGIERFTKRQRQLADDVRKVRQEQEAALAVENPTDEQMTALREIETRLSWQTRIFDDREKSTKYVCEVPTLLEQRLFLISREIANHLPS
jgi:hypothetical protein